jgi:hypothetical protein
LNLHKYLKFIQWKVAILFLILKKNHYQNDLMHELGNVYLNYERHEYKTWPFLQSHGEGQDEEDHFYFYFMYKSNEYENFRKEQHF